MREIKQFEKDLSFDLHKNSMGNNKCYAFYGGYLDTLFLS